MAKIEDLLIEWGLDDYTDNFIDNEVTTELLKDLNDDELKELIPILGHRVLLKKKCREMFGEKTKKDSLEDNVSDGPKPKKKKDEKTDDPDLILYSLPSVKSILNKGVGKTIVENYEIQHHLSEKTRNRIVEIVMKSLYERTNRPTNAVFKKVAEQICEEFPSESIRTYYISPVSKKNSKKETSEPSKGKIPIKWRNIQRSLKIEEHLDAASELPKPLNDNEEDIEEDIEESLEWLEDNEGCAVIEEATEHWLKTAKSRRSTIEKEAKTLSDTYDKFKILKHPEAYKLIRLDFKTLDLTAKEFNEESWITFIQKVLTNCSRDKYEDETAKTLKLFLRTPNLNADCRIKAEFELLCHLIPPKVVIRPKRKNTGVQKKTWKVSINECFQSIIQYTPLPTDIDDLRKRREDFMHDHDKRVQPYIIVTGPSATELDNFYVSVDKVMYQLPSLIEAFEVCFKTFHVFCLQYPLESEHLWLILQKVLFEFETKFDAKFSHVETIVHALRTSNSEDKD